MSLNLSDKSTLVQVMAWCRQGRIQDLKLGVAQTICLKIWKRGGGGALLYLSYDYIFF